MTIFHHKLFVGCKINQTFFFVFFVFDDWHLGELEERLRDSVCQSNHKKCHYHSEKKNHMTLNTLFSVVRTRGT